MRTQVVVIAFLGLAVSGCGESQSANVPVDIIELELPKQSCSETDLYSVIRTNVDGSRMVRYQVEIMSSQQTSFVDSNGQEIVRSEMVPRTEERVATVPPGEDIAEFLRVSAGGRLVQIETSLGVIPDVEPAPAPPAD